MTSLLGSIRERRALNAFNIGGIETRKSHAGVSVNRDSALRSTAVYRCVSLLAGTIAALPIDTFRKVDTRRIEVDSPPWLTAPNPLTSWFAFAEGAMTSLLLDGNAYIAIGERDSQLGLPSELWLLHPDRVRPVYNEKTGDLHYELDGTKRLSRYRAYEDRGGDVLQIKGFGAPNALVGLSAIQAAAQAIGVSVAAEKFAGRFFGEGMHTGAAITFPTNVRSDQFDAWVQRFEANHVGPDQSHKAVYLGGGAEFQSIGVKPNEAQFLESRRYQTEEICRIFGVPPHLVSDIERSTSWQAGIESLSRQFLTYTLLPWLRRLEIALDSCTPRGTYSRFNVNGLLRGTTKERFEAYGMLLDRGVISRNEVRAWEDWNAVAGLDDYPLPAYLQGNEDEQ
jgi:HK97 family phage portal protein